MALCIRCRALTTYNYIFVLFIFSILIYCYLQSATNSKEADFNTRNINLLLEELDGDEYSEAVCMDGSPAVFYHNILDGLSGKEVIIYLHGGGRCFSTVQCRERSDLILLICLCA